MSDEGTSHGAGSTRGRFGRRGLLGLALASAAGYASHAAASQAEAGTSGLPFLLEAENRAKAPTALVSKLSAVTLAIENRASPTASGFGGSALLVLTGPSLGSVAIPGSAAVIAHNRARGPGKVHTYGVWGAARGVRGVAVFDHSPDGVAISGSTLGSTLGEKGNPIAVRGESPEGTGGSFFGRVGIDVSGLARFRQAGTREVPEGSTSFDVVGARVSPESLVLATFQGPNLGVHVVSAKPLSGYTVRVFFSGPVPAGGAMLGYFVVN